MTDSVALFSLLAPFVSQFNPRSILTAGDTAAMCLQISNDTKLQHLKTPFSQEQLRDLQPSDLAVISHLVETMDKTAAQQWLGMIKNRLAPHVILMSHAGIANNKGWQFTDYLAMGFRHMAGTDDGLQVFTYAIENYQPRHDWLNSRYWANPELYDKYRW
jgi:Family of unknown function (DUF6231)